MLIRRVLVASEHHDELGQRLSAARADLELRGRRLHEVTPADLGWADAYFGHRRPPVDGMGNVRWVHSPAAGVESWLHPVELSPDILLTRTSEPFGVGIAEWALARALVFSQNILELAESQRQCEWAPRDARPLRGTTAVVVGTGDLGTNIGRLFAAIGCHVIGVSRTGRGDLEVFESVVEVSALEETVARADWLILTVPLTPATQGLIGRRVLEVCRGAVLINAGRGAVVDEELIPEAIDRGWLSGAALDVFSVEPLSTDSPLWTHPRVVISPHCSGPHSVEAEVAGFLECLAEIEHGERPARAVNRDRGY